MSVYESSITNPKKQLEFYKQLSEQLQQENKQLNQLLKDKGFIINKLMEENRQLKEKFLKQTTETYLRQTRIDNSIGFIEENKNKTYAPYGDNEDTDYEVCLDEDEIKYLLKLLRGDSNE